jgi:hypothetical protein
VSDLLDGQVVQSVEFLGERFQIAEQVSTLALMRFAKVASAGVDANDMDGLAAMYDLLEQCIDPTQWHAFQAHADRKRAQADDLLELVREVMPRIAARPTGRPSDSSDGPSAPSEPSVGDSSSRVIARLERQGRPDLALMVDQARASRASA